VNVVIVGATKGIGRALARQLAERGETLFLLGRDAADLERSARDLETRGANGRVGCAALDLEKPEDIPGALDRAWSALGKLDAVVVSAGLFGTQDRLESDPALLGRMLNVNFTNTVLFCEDARKRLIKDGGGTLCVFSSVAGDRARKPVVLYGAAKAGLSFYLEGLDHRYAASGLRVISVRPGFVKTSMTEGLPVPPFAGEPEGVAREVVSALDRPRPILYTPRIWRLVMWVIRGLPRLVMRRIRF
jgi:short-subunit dehydrogenase